jgi:hypothetical protein
MIFIKIVKRYHLSNPFCDGFTWLVGGNKSIILLIKLIVECWEVLKIEITGS